MVFQVQVEFGDGMNIPNTEAVNQINTLLNNLKDGFKLK